MYDHGREGDFDQFSKVQSQILPDVQKINRQNFLKLIKNEEIIISRTGKKVIGFVIYRKEGDQGYLRQLAVIPNYRRKGVAKNLVELTHEWFGNNGISLVKVLVKKQNKPAIRLYQDFDYSIKSELYQYIIFWTDFPESEIMTNVRELNIEEDKLVAEKYNITLSILRNYRELNSSINLGVFDDKANLIGFARLRPNFPVLTPIFLDDPTTLLDLLYTIKNKFANTNYGHIRVTKELQKGDPYYKILNDQKWSDLNFILVRMELEL